MLTQRIEGRAVQRVAQDHGVVLGLDDHSESVISRPLRLTLPAAGDDPVEQATIDPSDVPVAQCPLLDIAGARCTRAACEDDRHLHLEFASGHQIDVAGDHDGAAWGWHCSQPAYRAAAEGQRIIRWWTEATGAVLAAVHRILLTWAGRRPRRQYPRRLDYLERSCMQREMRRL
ncbi:DUF6188 family protein [Mycolicibacterium chubuense]|uniref:DUF6188 family protein n=1 Tax=Mycolicibacterium chubuense TaxID=1800 RepID=UPI000A2EFD8B|nr:DUF6188 family protein [Mycolicibacterium chubuense]